MSSTNTTSSGGIGFFGLLTILFVALKLTGYIDWSWGWVFAPLWGPVLFALFVIMLFLVFANKNTWK